MKLVFSVEGVSILPLVELFQIADSLTTAAWTPILLPGSCRGQSPLHTVIGVRIYRMKTKEVSILNRRSTLAEFT